MQVESSARDSCIFPPRKTFFVVGSLVKIIPEVCRGNADWIAAHSSSTTATEAANFAVRPTFWSSLQDGGIQTNFFFAVAGSHALESSPQNAAVGEMQHRVQSVLGVDYSQPGVYIFISLYHEMTAYSF